MAKKVTLGGDRIKSGSKNEIQLHGYERSNVNKSKVWRNTQSAGTLVPCWHEYGLPGDTWDIDMIAEVLTHPAEGPLFGSFSLRVEIYQAPVRLYHGWLHNNKLKVGMHMENVILPYMNLQVNSGTGINLNDPGSSQINPSCILAYLGIRGIGFVDPGDDNVVFRSFPALKFLTYWDTYKNFYANKQEGIGVVIHNTSGELVNSVEGIDISGTPLPIGENTGSINTGTFPSVVIEYAGSIPKLEQIVFYTNAGNYTAEQINVGYILDVLAGTITFNWDTAVSGVTQVTGWGYVAFNEIVMTPPELVTFPLENIDTMRENLLINMNTVGGYNINNGLEPYSLILDWDADTDRSPLLSSQEGLGIKTYDSDLLNNWIDTELIDGVDGITEITKVDVTDGYLKIDTLNLATKIYYLLNRVAVSDGTYKAWVETVYDVDLYMAAYTPIYEGGMTQEIIFQEVVSNSGNPAEGERPSQPLGTMAGKGTLKRDSKKGGQTTIKVREHSVLMAVCSITPKIDYSQGNKWDNNIRTMDDFHKPQLDEIGFEELTTEQMAWWDTSKIIGQQQWITRSAGKTPAWTNYRTDINEVFGNFAIQTNEMFMILNRRYEYRNDAIQGRIADLTTYIDPRKFNFIFAQTSLDAMNFWVQIGMKITARRKMSNRIMPNL